MSERKRNERALLMAIKILSITLFFDISRARVCVCARERAMFSYRCCGLFCLSLPLTVSKHALVQYVFAFESTFLLAYVHFMRVSQKNSSHFTWCLSFILFRHFLCDRSPLRIAHLKCGSRSICAVTFLWPSFCCGLSSTTWPRLEPVY